MKEILNLKREQFHLSLEKQKRDQILKSRRKLFLEKSYQKSNSKYNDILNELTEENANFQKKIERLVYQDDIVNNIVSAVSLGYNRHIPAMILYNLSLTQGQDTLEVLIKNYSIHQIFLKKSCEDDNEICLISLSGINNLLRRKNKEMTEYFIENGLVENLILKGKLLVEAENFGEIFNEIITFFFNIFKNVKKFSLEHKLKFQLLFDVFRISQKSLNSKDESSIIKMFRIIEFTSNYLSNLIEFLDDDWLFECDMKLDEWLLIKDEQMINSCSDGFRQLFRNSDGNEREIYKKLKQKIGKNLKDIDL